MKVQSKLYLMTSMVLVIMLVMSTSLVWAYFNIEQVLQRDRYITNTLKAVTGLSHRLRSVVERGDKNDFLQWRRGHAELQLLLEDTPDSSLKQSDLMKKMEGRNRGIMPLFSRLEAETRLRQGVQATALEMHLAEKLFFQLEAIREDTFHLLAISQQNIEEVLFLQGTGFISIVILTTIILTILATRLSKGIQGSLRQLIKGLQLAGSGSFDKKITGLSDDEIGEVGAHFNKMLGQLENTTVSRDRLQELVDLRTKELLQISETDALTGVPNRRHYERRLAEEIASSRRNKTSLGMLMLDIDYFKGFNDRYGHDSGDIALRRVAQSIAETLPRDTDFVARFGGEEFVILMPATDVQGAYQVAERIRLYIKALKIPHLYSNGINIITVSIGVAAQSGQQLNEADLLRHADKALYMAKDRGRNQSVVYEHTNA